MFPRVHPHPSRKNAQTWQEKQLEPSTSMRARRPWLVYSGHGSMPPAARNDSFQAKLCNSASTALRRTLCGCIGAHQRTRRIHPYGNDELLNRAQLTVIHDIFAQFVEDSFSTHSVDQPSLDAAPKRTSSRIGHSRHRIFVMTYALGMHQDLVVRLDLLLD
jgi:hypothetical protein